MRVVNGMPLLLAALMLTAGVIPAAAQDVGSTGEVEVVDLVAEAGPGSVEASVDEAADDAVGDDSVTFDPISAEVSSPDPLDIAAGGVEGPVEDFPDETSDYEVLVLTGDDAEPMTEAEIEMMLVATGTGSDGVIPGAGDEEVSLSDQQGSSDGETCAMLPLAKRPQICD